jgi:hypothetical protein
VLASAGHFPTSPIFASQARASRVELPALQTNIRRALVNVVVNNIAELITTVKSFIVKVRGEQTLANRTKVVPTLQV